MTWAGAPDRGGDANAILAAVEWIQGLLLGPFATALAVIAVASLGFGMLAGRVNLRRGATVILGCFILFGAAGIAQGLRGLAEGGVSGASQQASPEAPGPEYEYPAPQPPPESFDPYAGAALRR